VESTRTPKSLLLASWCSSRINDRGFHPSLSNFRIWTFFNTIAWGARSGYWSRI